MRKTAGLLVLNLMLGAVACEVSTGDDDEENNGTATGRGDPSGGERGRPVPPDGGGARDAGTPSGDAATATNYDAGQPAASGDAGSATEGSGDAGAVVTAPSLSDSYVALAECVARAPSNAECGATDVLEPNNIRSASLLLEPRDGCAVVSSKLSTGKDEDHFQFVPERTEPVRIALAYDAPPASPAAPKFQLHDAMNTLVTYAEGTPADNVWKWTYNIVVKKGIAYYVRVYDGNGSNACTGYTLRVEPNFCTDTFEDNDTAAAATPGLAYGNTLEGTVFYQDEDFFDLSAIQAAGARCTVTLPEITLSSTETINIHFRKGNGDLVKSDKLSGASTSNALVFTLPAASGAATLRLFSDKYRCTKYSVSCVPL
ncbi:MAG: hypothetical protein ABW352_12220 [Polyangiales bacterium]